MKSLRERLMKEAGYDFENTNAQKIHWNEPLLYALIDIVCLQQETLEDIIHSLENGDWSCSRCSKNPEMQHTDINYMSKKAIETTKERLKD